MSVIDVERACVEFDGDHVLENIDLRIEAGEFVALLGPNGSGKSTLVRAILGLQPLEHGRVRLFDEPLGRFSDWSRIALVPQRLPGTNSIPVSVWETVISGRITPRARFRRVGKEAKATAQLALTEVGLWPRRHDRLDTLSGGQQRRVLIARALATSADLLVMDEPTAGIDAENLTHLVHLLGELHKQGVTVLVVTHELTDIEHLVTRAIVLGEDRTGTIRYDGPPPVPASFADAVHHHDDHPHDQSTAPTGLTPR
jgi:zinc transport system ATP-binding protein